MSLKGGLSTVLIVALVFSVSGCSGYRVSRLPPGASAGELNGPAEDVVQAGQTARIIMNNGTSITGSVIEVSSESITLGKVGNYGFEETVVLAAEIERIEIESGSLSSTVIAGVLSVAAVSLLVTVTAKDGPEPQPEPQSESGK